MIPSMDYPEPHLLPSDRREFITGMAMSNKYGVGI